MNGIASDTQGTFRHDINALRAVAVLGVLLFHFGIAPFDGGFAGVDVFFVISGYLMTEIIERRMAAGRFSVTGFWLDRVRRIVPALVAAVLATVAFGYWFVDPLAFREMGVSALWAILFVSNFDYWLAGGYFDGPQQAKWFLHTWSLSVEWQFYLLYPIAMALLFRMIGKRSIIVAVYTSVAALSLAACLWAATYGVHMHPRIGTANFYLLPTRAWEMMLGGLIALHPAWLTRYRHRLLHWAGFALIAASMLVLRASTQWPSVATFVPALGTAAVLLASRQARWTKVWAVARVGTWSYSIYLWHWPLNVALHYFEIEVTPLVGLAAILASIGLGALSFYVVETPSRRWLRDLKAARWLVAGGVGLLPLCAAAVVVASDGEPGRRGLDPQVYETLRTAAADWDFSCPPTFFNTQDYPRCVRGSGSRRVALVGDSHMQQWYGRYGHLADGNAEVHFLTSSGCPPIPNTGRIANGSACYETIDAILKRLAAGDFDLVVVEASWNYYAYMRDGRLCFLRPGTCRQVADDEYGAAFQQGVNDMASRLVALAEMGTQVVVVLDIPKAGNASPIDLARRYFWGGTLNDVAWKTREPPNAFLLAALSGENITIVDPKDYVCEKTRCRVVTDDGWPLYKDDGHLRSTTTRMDDFGFLDPYVLGAPMDAPAK